MVAEQTAIVLVVLLLLHPDVLDSHEEPDPGLLRRPRAQSRARFSLDKPSDAPDPPAPHAPCAPPAPCYGLSAAGRLGKPGHGCICLACWLCNQIADILA